MKITEVDRAINALAKQVRVRANLTQQQTADIMGVSLGQVQKYEACKDRIGAAKLFALSVAAGVPVGDLFPSGGHDGA